jgi:hypothetical protein
MANSVLELTRELLKLKKVKEMTRILGKVELLLKSQYSSGIHSSKSERVRDKTIDNDKASLFKQKTQDLPSSLCQL